MRGLVLASLLLPSVAAGATLNLSPGDNLPELLEGLAAGDEAVLASGTYAISETLRLHDIQATEGAPTVLRAAEGATPVIEMMGSGWIVHVARSAHVQVRGLTLRGGGDFVGEERGVNGIVVNEGSADVVIVGNTIADITGDGIRSSDGAGLVIRHNEVARTSGGLGISLGQNDASSWVQDAVVTNNYLHDLPREALWVGPGSFGNRFADNVAHAVQGQAIFVVQSTEFGAPNVLEGNALWDGGGHGMTIGGSAIVRNNVVFNVVNSGIRAVPSNGAAYDDVVISFNTIAQTGNDGADLRDWAGHTGMVFANNAISNPTGYAFEAEEGDIDEGNLIVGNVVTGLVRGFEELAGHYVPGHGEGDFEDAAAWNFYPTAAGTLRDAADPSGATFVPEVDFNGLPRSGEAPDVGALEYGDPSNPGWLIREGFKAPPAAGTGDTEVDGCESCDDGDASAALLPLLLLGLGRRRLGEAGGR